MKTLELERIKLNYVFRMNEVPRTILAALLVIYENIQSKLEILTAVECIFVPIKLSETGHHIISVSIHARYRPIECYLTATV